ncbi:hypothetical protein [Methanopyrus kandleri]|uniref:Uncharacterized protein n=1 Tax=Methanopyrus kandleri (strain AV19 / DSM 6324 / JCM 9639 / NBRC 100938) TaxID=190192 RepID=Q8TW69_METKA|nr:hypothetical protein [Methanopyrus kandleri]AAM02380.1 Uncharacterized protein MK1167 [Methanopyrus kandleri AV19]
MGARSSSVGSYPTDRDPAVREGAAGDRGGAPGGVRGPESVGRGPDAVWNVSDLVVEALWSSGLVYVDVSGARGPEIAGIPLGLAALEVPGLSVGGGREVRFVAGRLEDDVLTDVTEHFGAAGALIWTIICSWKPSPEAARRAIEPAERAGVDVRELDRLGEYVDALDTAQVGEVLAGTRPDRETIRTIVRILRRVLHRVYATDGRFAPPTASPLSGIIRVHSDTPTPTTCGAVTSPREPGT